MSLFFSCTDRGVGCRDMVRVTLLSLLQASLLVRATPQTASGDEYIRSRGLQSCKMQWVVASEHNCRMYAKWTVQITLIHKNINNMISDRFCDFIIHKTNICYEYMICIHQLFLYPLITTITTAHVLWLIYYLFLFFLAQIETMDSVQFCLVAFHTYNWKCDNIIYLPLNKCLYLNNYKIF